MMSESVASVCSVSCLEEHEQSLRDIATDSSLYCISMVLMTEQPAGPEMGLWCTHRTWKELVLAWNVPYFGLGTHAVLCFP